MKYIERCTYFDFSLLPLEGGKRGMSSPSTPFPWKGDARRAGVGRRRKRAKPTSGATRHLLPKEGGRSGMSNPSPLPREGDRRSVTTLIVRKRRGVYIGQCHFRASPYIYSRRSRHHKFESRDEWLGIRETLIKSQNQISYGFLYIASSSSSLNSSLFASDDSLLCIKIQE